MGWLNGEYIIKMEPELQEHHELLDHTIPEGYIPLWACITCNQRILSNTGNSHSLSTENIKIKVKHPRSIPLILLNKRVFYY